LELVVFVNELKCLTFDGSFAEDQRQNQPFRSEQNKALEAVIKQKTENCALTSIPQP
jgi:hypothetical protein